MSMRRLKYLLLVLGLGLIFSLWGCLPSNTDSSDTNPVTTDPVDQPNNPGYSADLEYIVRLIDLIQNNSLYYDNQLITKEQLLEGAYRGMLEALGDPYSVYMNQKEFLDFLQQMSGSFAGAGISISQIADYSIVVNVIDNSPAERAGVQKGDIILSVDGVSMIGKTTSEIADTIKGPKGTQRQVTFYRNGQEITFGITLDDIIVRTVKSEIFTENNKKIGYIEISSFGNETFTEFKTAVESLNAQGISSLILDVRNNPGGRLDTVVNMMDYLLDTDEPLVYVKDRSNILGAYVQNNYQNNFDFDIYVLINENSASASEVFAAALNQIGGYELIGKTTFGKGTVQVLDYVIPSKTVVKLTVETWLTPNQSWIQDVGVEPTYDVTWDFLVGMTYVDFELAIAYDQVNLSAIPLQRFLKQKINPNLRTDGYIDQNTIDALTMYQQSKGINDHLGQLDFYTIYLMNLDIIDIVHGLDDDPQFLKALELASK